MAGAYQTAGESARRGCGVAPDSGGGWVTGRGDETMTLFDGFRPIVEFFTGFDWWRANPEPDVITSYEPGTETIEGYYTNGGDPATCDEAYCLADPGDVYAFYLPAGGRLTAQLADGPYGVERFDPRTGETEPLGPTPGGDWTSPELPDQLDWAFRLQRV